jgi:hypothetical protein
MSFWNNFPASCFMTDFEIVVIQSEITRNIIREREIEDQSRRRNDAPLLNLQAPTIDLIPQPTPPIPPAPTPPLLQINTIPEEQDKNMAEAITIEEISSEDISIQEDDSTGGPLIGRFLGPRKNRLNRKPSY